MHTNPGTQPIEHIMEQDFLKIVNALEAQIKILSERMALLTDTVSDAIELSGSNQQNGIKTIEMMGDLTKGIATNMSTLSNLTSAIKSLDKRLRDVESFNSLSEWGRGKKPS